MAASLASGRSSACTSRPSVSPIAFAARRLSPVSITHRTPSATQRRDGVGCVGPRLVAQADQAQRTAFRDHHATVWPRFPTARSVPRAPGRWHRARPPSVASRSDQRPPATRPCTALPGTAAASVTGGIAIPRPTARRRIAWAKRVARALLDRGRRGQEPFLVPGQRHQLDHLRPAQGQRAGLVERYRHDLADRLERGAALEEQARRAPRASPGGDRCRRREHQGTGAGDQEQRQAAVDPGVPVGPERERRDERRPRPRRASPRACTRRRTAR